MSGKSLGGVAATDDYVISSGRELADTNDVFRCLRADTGAQVWALRYAAPGGLDYGNSPRATPLIHDGVAFLFGAFGHLHAVELATGRLLWRKDLKTEFQSAGRQSWGACSSPLIADGKLIVNPGGPDASLVALNPRDGTVIWRTPGGPAGYGSLIAGEFGGALQIVGHDEDSLGGWDAKTGKRLWSVEPPRKNDYNVPTPLVYRGDLIVATENNGLRRFRFRDNGTIDPQPVATSHDLNPETITPVIVGDRLFGVANRTLSCFDLSAGLKLLWSAEDAAFEDHVSLIGSDSHVLICDWTGEMILIDARANEFRPVQRVRALADETGLYSHPAIAKKRIYWRGGESLFCISLE